MATPQKPVHINLLVDLSGTLHIGDTPCPGAVEALRRLRTARPSSASTRLSLRFCSNTTKESTGDLHARLLRAGFDGRDVAVERIITGLGACCQLVKRENWRPFLMLSPSSQEMFRQPGEGTPGDAAAADQAFYPHKDTSPSQLSDEERARLRACDTVVIGAVKELFTHEWLDEAFRILIGEYQPGPKRLVAAHRVAYTRPKADEPLSLGPGAFVAALEAAANRSPSDTIVCGKPSEAFLQICLESLRAEHKPLGSQPNDEPVQERNIIMGDDVINDLGTDAIKLGLERVLVQSGKYRPGDEDRSPADHPVKLYASFAEFVDKELFASGLLQDAKA